MSSWDSSGADEAASRPVDVQSPDSVESGPVESGPVESGPVERAGEAVADDPSAGQPADADELATLERTPLAEHPAIFEGIHARLQASLAEIDSA